MQTKAFQTTQLPVIATMMSTTGEIKYHASSTGGGDMPTPPAEDDDDEAEEEPDEK